ncbi:hypothetical protein [Streptomyces luteolus]|uniref:Uncharacterized protein n=1 Tax=Streptomyces luteolus TaxID=3043615 RepID=A0ABT6SSY0_9ACTN|nr:hypothetical protein [Streptomyces sp. B-S-A12]MDI3418709.1 hypothetical protein [Streptomyces sp. B-S-A12]
MAALEDSSQGRTRDRRSVYKRYQEATETASDGQLTDVEREDAEEGVDRITSPVDPEHIDIETRTTTIDLRTGSGVVSVGRSRV